MNPTVSIITACYNAEKFIEETINSVINQTYTNWEWIIVDDGSSDPSVDIIKEWTAKDPRIKMIALGVNAGPAIARNKGIELAKGTYLTFIDADDLWNSNFLEINLKRIDCTEGFLCASYEMYDEHLSTKLGELIVPPKAAYNSILKTNTVSCLTAFIDIDKLGKAYMPEIAYRQDMGLWLQYLKKINYVVGIQQCLAIYRIRKNSHSRSKMNLLKHQWYFYRKVAHLNWIKSLYFFMIWVLYGLRKYYF